MKKRIFSILLTLCMVLMLCPVTAFADEHVYRVAGTSELCGSNWDEADDNNRMTYNGETGRYEKVYTGLIPGPYLYKIAVDGTTWIPDGGETDIPTVYVAADNATVTIWYHEKTGEWGADVAYPTLAITVDGFEVGKTPNDCTYSFESTIPGVTFSKDDIEDIWWDKYAADGDRYPISNTDAFKADTLYRLFINLDNNGLTEVPTITVNGKTPDYATKDGEPIQLQIECDLGTPEPILTLTVPFTTTVKLGGNVAPGETTFMLGLIDSAGNELKYDDVYFGAVVTSDGAGEYEGELTITGPESQLWNMLSDGVFVQQVNAGAPNWTYDDTVWGLYLKNFAELAADDAAPEYTVLIFPATCEKTDNGMFYSMVDGANAVARMSFTNTYTYSAPVRDTTTIVIGGEKEENKPVEENPNTGALDNVLQTGGSSSLTLWFALLAISAAGVIGTGAYCKRRRSSRAK